MRLISSARTAARDCALALALALAGTLLAATGAAHAQTWPERPIKFVMTAPAGSSIDVLGRAIADKLGPRLGQPVVVENKPAAGGTVATGEVAHATPDGYTMLLGYNGPLSFTPLLQKLPYDVQKDLAPVITTTSQPNVLAVSATLPVNTLAELVAYAKANPGKLSYASVGNGSSSHLNMELFKQMAGIDVVHIPFNGSPPAVMSTIQGETQMLFAVMQPLQAQIKAGKLKAIAVTTAKPFPLLPGIPSIAESGYPGFEALAWNGVMVPAGTPKAVIDRLNREINAIFREPDVIEKMNSQGFALVGGTPEQFGKLVSDEAARWTPVIRKVGLKVD
jgi:tripartite-type tricarboxylate transporter receptor subunit TctC